VILFEFYLIIDAFFLIAFVLLSYTTLYIYRFVVLDKSRRELKKRFSLYVAPDIVDDISHNPDAVTLEGQEKDISILFSDIVGFTSISETTDTKSLVTLLNEYFAEMTAIIHQYKGTLDKYIGDAVMCFFNAPLDLPNHSFYACKTALAQQARLRDLRTKWSDTEKPLIRIRIGLHM